MCERPWVHVRQRGSVTMKKYVVKNISVYHNDRIYTPDSVVELTEYDAAPLLSMGAVELIEEQESEAKKGVRK